jgi:uncharacterized transporter YbjL
MKAIAGYAILAVLFIVYFGVHVAAHGLAASLFVFGAAFGVLALVVLAAWLIASD